MQDFTANLLEITSFLYTKNAIHIGVSVDGHPLGYRLTYSSVDFHDEAFLVSGGENLKALCAILGLLSCTGYGSLLPRYVDFTQCQEYIPGCVLTYIKWYWFHALSEHRYQLDQMVTYKLPKFIFDKRLLGRKVSLPLFASVSRSILLCSGSGKDSVLCACLLRDAGLSYDLISQRFAFYGTVEEQAKIADMVNLHFSYNSYHTLLIENEFNEFIRKRAVDTMIRHKAKKLLFALDAAEGLVTAVFNIPFQIMHKLAFQLVGNEKDSDLMNLSGEDVYHQFTKSIVNETKLRDLFRQLFVGIVRVSLLKPFHDAKIFKTVFKIGGKLPYLAHSCNVKKPWCKNCSKCAYVFAGYAAYGDWNRVMKTFEGVNMFDIDTEGMRKIWEELVGLGGFIPFECGGPANKTKIFIYKTYKKGITGFVMDLVKKELEDKGEEYFEALEKRYLRLDCENHLLPPWIWDPVKTLLKV